MFSLQTLLVLALALPTASAFSPNGNPRGENARAQARLERIRAQRAAAQAKANPLMDPTQPQERPAPTPLPVGPTPQHEARLQQIRANRQQEVTVMTLPQQNNDNMVAVESLTQILNKPSAKTNNLDSINVQQQLEQTRLNQAASQVYNQLYQNWHAEWERLEQQEQAQRKPRND